MRAQAAPRRPRPDRGRAAAPRWCPPSRLFQASGSSAATVISPSGGCAARLPRNLSACLKLQIGVGELRVDQQGVHGPPRTRRRAAGEYESPRMGSATRSGASPVGAIRLQTAALLHNRMFYLAAERLDKSDHFAEKSEFSGLRFSRRFGSFEALPGSARFRDAAASRDQVEDQNDQREHQQKVNQTTGYVEAEAQDPQNHNDRRRLSKAFALLFRIAGPRPKSRLRRS